MRRIRAMIALGHEVHSFTMRRDNMNQDFAPDWPNTHLYNTENEKLLKRVVVIAKAIAKMAHHRDRVAAADIIFARNLDMLVIAWVARLISGARNVPLVYECLDINNALCGDGAKARALRWAERKLLGDINMLVVSSPAFIRQYFQPFQGYSGNWALWENKIATGTALPPRPVHHRAPAPEDPLKLGWVGSIRCAPSLALLSALADCMGSKIEVHIHGVVHRHVLADFETVIAARPNMAYHGPYTYPCDIASMYEGVDLVWAQDLWQADTNSDWLLPNRIYEASWAGCPSIAVSTTETGRRVTADGLGWVIECADVGELQRLFERLSKADINRRGQALLDRPAQNFVQSADEIDAVINAVQATTPAQFQASCTVANSVDPSRILVAIPTLNEERHIEATLDSLFKGSAGLEAAKIVVADGGSKDATRDIVRSFAARRPNVHLIANPDRLQSAAINLVVEKHAEAQHDILVRIDAHAHYPSGFVLAVAESLEAHDSAALATVMDSAGETCLQRGAAWAMDTKLGSGGSAHRGGTHSGYVDHGHHAGFRLDAFRRANGYDTGFVANEDAELDHRLALQNGKIWLDATIRLTYLPRSSLGELARQYWRYGIGRAQTVMKHRIRPRARQMVPPVVLLVNIAAFLLALARPVFLALPVCYLLLLLVCSLSLVLRHRSVCALWAGPALLVMHVAWGAGFLWKYTASRAGLPAERPGRFIRS